MTDRVCIAWMKGDRLYGLTYGDGKVRTYQQDKVDGRVEPGPTIERAADLWPSLETGAICRVPVGIARSEFGWCKFA